MGVFEKIVRKPLTGLIAIGGKKVAILVDATFNALITITPSHHEIHEADSFYVYKKATLASGEKLTIALTTPNSTKLSHMTHHLDNSGESDFDILENVTSFANGATFNIINRHRDKAVANPSACVALVASDAGTDTAIVPTGGSEIDSSLLGSGKDGGAAPRGQEEIVLKRNTKYLFRVTSGAVGNRVTLKINWYEHININ